MLLMIHQYVPDFHSGCVTCKLCSPHSHIFSAISHPPGGCVCCKLCNSHSHITFLPSTKWLCKLQTLQPTQPHLFHDQPFTQVAVSLANFAAHTATSLFHPQPSTQVAVSLANFAAHTAKSFFHHHLSTKWLCHLQTLQLTQPHHVFIIIYLPSGCVTCKLCSSHSHIIFPS